MTLRILGNMFKQRHSPVLWTVLCFFALCAIAASAAPRKRARKAVDDRVYLVHADELRYDMYGPNPDAQIVKGHVSFRHQGATLTCDSAYFYQATNSVRAMGHVYFHQAQDRISLSCQRAWYDGQEQLMEARNNVVLHHGGKTLYTDSLNYDRLYSNAYFFRGGRLVDGASKLSSDWGEYNTETRQAVFYYDVQLRTPKTRVSTDTLYYDTRTSKAHVVGLYTADKGKGREGPSRIVNGGNVITTTNAWFNTNTDKADLYGRSTVVNKDKSITADTLFYNSKTGRNYGHGNVVYVDKRNKNKLTCREMVYNEKTGKGFATGRALATDYSKPDTLWMHADTLRVETFHINTDSVYRKVHGYRRVRVFRNDIQAVCDSLVGNSRDSSMTMYGDPIVWSGPRQLVGEKIILFMNDSTIREARVLGQAMSIELMPDSTHYNQVSSRDMYAYFIHGQLRRSDAVSNVRSVYFPVDDKDSTLIGLNYVETDTMRSFMGADRKLQRIWMPKSQGTLYPMTQIPPGKLHLENFAWFDYIRPLGKDDVFEYRGKKRGTEIRRVKRHEAPLQTLGKASGSGDKPKDAFTGPDKNKATAGAAAKKTLRR